MPWEVRKAGGKFLVFKKGGTRPLGTHPTRAKAASQVAALYASEPKGRTVSAARNKGQRGAQMSAGRSATPRPAVSTARAARKRMAKKATAQARQYALSKRK